MYAENLEAAEEVIRRLFDPRRTYKKAYISPEIKLAYLQHYLESRWTEIVGENLARSCAIEKISGSELYVRTANSMLANELYMMQQLFLQKINSFLLGRVLIKKVYFHTGSFFRKQQQKEKEAEPPARLRNIPNALYAVLKCARDWICAASASASSVRSCAASWRSCCAFSPG